MGMPALKGSEPFTWEQYRQWPDDESWEVVGGEAYAMSPSPGGRHQLVSGELHRQFANFFRGKPCVALAAPLDVKLSETDIVQPDLLVVCDRTRIRDTHVEGPPTLVVEIVSPSSEWRDRFLKAKLYERFGIREYWIATPYPPLIEIFAMDDSGRYRLHTGGTVGDTVTGIAFPELTVRCDEVFAMPYTEDERRIFTVREPPTVAYASQVS